MAWIFFSWFYRYLAKVRGLDLKASAFYTMLPFLAMLRAAFWGSHQRPAHAAAWTHAWGAAGWQHLRSRLQASLSLLDPRCRARDWPASCSPAAQARSIFAKFFLVGYGRHCWCVSGSVSGFMNMGNQIGAALTASLTPWIAARFGWTASFLVAAALCLVGALSWLVVDPSRQLTSAPLDGTYSADSKFPTYF